MSEASGDNLNLMVSNLDGARIGRMGINKCTACGDVWLTVYDADAVENHKEFFEDDQLSFWPAELLAFCREVIRITNLQLVQQQMIVNNNGKGKDHHAE